MSKIAVRQFVPNFISYVSVKYCFNWFAVEKVIIKIKRVNFSETQCSYHNEEARALMVFL